MKSIRKAHGFTCSCGDCHKAWIREQDWGIFEWDAENRYPKTLAIKVFASKLNAEKAAERLGKLRKVDNLVVRSVTRMSLNPSRLEV